MTSHSKMHCPILGGDITIISYPPYGNSWSGWVSGEVEIICPHKTYDRLGICPVCRKESGRVYVSGAADGLNVCIMER